jgi:hypothetical protein
LKSDPYAELHDKIIPENNLLRKYISPLSDVNAVKHSGYNMSYKHFPGVNPEDDVTDSRTLTKFSKLCFTDIELLNMLINKTVEPAFAARVQTVHFSAVKRISR